MFEAGEDSVTLLNHLIGDATAHLSGQMLRIADLAADDQPTDEDKRAL